MESMRRISIPSRDGSESIVFLGIGSNQGDRIANCKAAIERMKEMGLDILMLSSFYETEPHGDRGQPWYINCVAKVKTGLPPRELLKGLQDIESIMGRERKGRWTPRSIDLDILFYGDRIICEEDLKVPHPLLHERGFVIIPLLEIEPELKHPVIGKDINALFTELRDAKMVTRL